MFSICQCICVKWEQRDLYGSLYGSFLLVSESTHPFRIITNAYAKNFKSKVEVGLTGVLVK